MLSGSPSALMIHRPAIFPTVTLLQIACQLHENDSVAFLLDPLAFPLPSIYSLLKEVGIRPDILKLGFRFKQDLEFLSNFFLQRCDPGFDRVEPYLDITSLYNYLLHKQPGRKLPKGDEMFGRNL